MSGRAAALRLGALLLLAAFGCRGLYYGAMERIGREKRHILASRVADGREDQRAAQVQFQSALEAFQALTGFQGGDLEDVYDRLRSEYERSEARADEVRERIASIEQVAGDLFEEWEDEIGQISTPRLRQGSRARLRATQRSYQRMISAMQRASRRMDPVLTAFRDRVLYLKHNLNARAIASLEADRGEIESDVARLVDEMNASIEEAESFLSDFERRDAATGGGW